MAYANILIFSINTMELSLINANIWESYQQSFWVTCKLQNDMKVTQIWKSFQKFGKMHLNRIELKMKLIINIVM